MDIKEAILKLASTAGVSGTEAEAAELAKAMLEPYCKETYIDKRGTVVGIMGSGNAPVFHLDAHIDRIGLIVTDVAERGFVKFAKCGGIDERTLAGMEVTILGKEPVFGVVSSIPPHLSNASDEGKAKSCTDLAIDTGLSEDKAKELIRKGDRAYLKSYPCELLGGLMSMGALDDRSGVACLIKVAELLSEMSNPPAVIFTFSVLEEVGGKGAATASFDMKPDCSIAVDVSFARTPGCDKSETAELSAGPMIGYSPVLDHELSEKLESIAKINDIPYQKEIMNSRTGTHADELAVNAGGVKTGLISIPLKYMHTPVEVIDPVDVENSAKLIAQFIMSEGGAENA